MTKIFISLGFIASLYGSTIVYTSSTNNFFGKVQNSQYTKVSMNEAKFSQEDMQKEIDFFTDPSRCFNAFSIPDFNNLSFSPFSILTQIQNKDFYLKIIRKHTKICSDISDVNVTLIDKDGNKIDYDKSSLNPITEPSYYGYIVIPIQFNVYNAYRDVFVHFSYKIKHKKIICPDSTYTGVTSKCYTITTTTSKEENATDDFAVRPKQFNISAASTTFIGNPLNIDINVTNKNGNISTNYNADDIDLNTSTNPNNIYLSYFYNIVNGKLGRHKFFFTKPSNDVKIQISEKLGKEWAIVDTDDTKNSRILIKPGKSNSIKILETSKNWVGVGTGEKENSPTNKTIQLNIRGNTNRNLKFHKIGW